MPFDPGTEVIVLPLNRRGEIEQRLRDRVYRVRVGSMTTTARELDLRAVSPKEAKRRRSEERAGEAEPPAHHGRGVSASLDLHGLTVDEARNRVAAFISRALLAGLDRVEIVHGIGTGRLKAAVTADLKKISAVRRVEPHPENPGVLTAYL